jgi:ribonucleoside-diphosphate reductase alpha chain
VVIVEERYTLPAEFRRDLHARPVDWPFGALSEATYYRTYSRVRPDGRQEAWADTVIRVVEGVMSIRKDWLKKVGRRWREDEAHGVATRMAEAIFTLKMLPPGRGLWAMGTEYVFERGSHALNNCGFVAVDRSLADAAAWLMDSLMCGVGVGFSTDGARLTFKQPRGSVRTYEIPDTKEGWAESVRRLIQSYERGSRPWAFDYSRIRQKGAPIRGFGGVSSGYAPLEQLHQRLARYLDARIAGEVSDTRVIADVMNAIGACVVAGNVRRSAEIALGSIADQEFINLKNYDVNPDRAEIGWMSNNSVVLRREEDFLHLADSDVAQRIADNGEPGIINMLNVQKYARMGDKSYGSDQATGINPCAEIPLESQELCNLVEVFPTRCGEDFQDVLWLATYYASTVSLLASHSAATNEVVERNRRIGVSVSGVADWVDTTSMAHVISQLNRGYELVRYVNASLAHEAGVPPAIRVTTVKPSGTVSLLAGVSSGMHFPVGGHVLRRMRVATDSPVAELLVAGGVPHEEDAYSDNTLVFEFPLHYGQGKTRSVKHVSVYEQAAIVAMLQRFWADNAVSNTLTVQPRELKEVGSLLATFAWQVKSLSLLPDRDETYAQLPIERITREEFELRTAALGRVPWEVLHGSDGEQSGYCTDDVCEIPVAV